MKLIKLCAVLAIVVALQTSAFGVINLAYEQGPNIGQGVAAGTVLSFKISNWDVGTNYAVPVAPIGYSGGPTGPPGPPVGPPYAPTDSENVLGVIPVNAAALGPVPGALATTTRYPGAEDLWGIAKVNVIKDSATGFNVWTEAVKQQELTAIFYGEQDIFIESLGTGAGGNDIRIDGVNLRVDLYSKPYVAANVLDPSGGTAVRTPANTYPGVNQSGETLELSMVSLPGYINGVGQGAGLATEFESRFNFTSLTGEGDCFLEILGGASRSLFDGDFWGVADSWAMPAANQAGMAGFDLDADISLAFDASTEGLIADWLVTSDDPMKVTTYVPEPITMLGLFMGLGGVGAYIRKRRMA